MCWGCRLGLDCVSPAAHCDNLEVLSTVTLEQTGLWLRTPLPSGFYLPQRSKLADGGQLKSCLCGRAAPTLPGCRAGPNRHPQGRHDPSAALTQGSALHQAVPYIELAGFIGTRGIRPRSFAVNGPTMHLGICHTQCLVQACQRARPVDHPLIDNRAARLPSCGGDNTPKELGFGGCGVGQLKNWGSHSQLRPHSFWDCLSRHRQEGSREHGPRGVALGVDQRNPCLNTPSSPHDPFRQTT